MSAVSEQTPRERLESTLAQAAQQVAAWPADVRRAFGHEPQPNPEIAPMTTAKITLQNPAETALWTDLVQRLSRSQSMECAIEDADLAVMALRERMPAAPEPAPAEPIPLDCAERAYMHALLLQAEARGMRVRCTLAEGDCVEGKPTLDRAPGAAFRIVKVEIL